MQEVDIETLWQGYRHDATLGELFHVESDEKAAHELSEPLLMKIYGIMFCDSGRMDISVDGVPYSITDREMVIVLPGRVVDWYIVSEGSRFHIISISSVTMIRSIFINDELWRLYAWLLDHPIMHLRPGSKKVLNDYIRLVRHMQRKPDGQYDDIVMQNIIANAVYGTLNIVSYNASGQLEEMHLKPGYNLFIRFLKEVTLGKGQIRSVKEVSDKLCVTSKHLTRAVTGVSGIPPLEWIHEYTVRTIVQELYYSDKSVKEIAAGLGFPNQSSFGTFVRKKTGMSPSRFRERKLFKSSH